MAKTPQKFRSQTGHRQGKVQLFLYELTSATTQSWYFMSLVRGEVELNPGPGEEPVACWGHIATLHGGKLYLWGGKVNTDVAEINEKHTTLVYTFDVKEKVWALCKSEGQIPVASERCAYTTHETSLYVYGGYNHILKKHDNALHKLDLETFQWTKMPTLANKNPGKKSASGMTIQMNMLVLFGGFGFPPEDPHSDANYVTNKEYFDDGRGWTNDLYVYPLSEGLWQFKPSQGTPQPCNGFSFISYEEKYIFKYGGTEPKKRCITAMHLLDISTWEWREIDTSKITIPEGRSFHSSCTCLMGGSLSLIVTGGESRNKQILSDMWAFCFKTSSWAQVELQQINDIKRSHHSATCVSLSNLQMEMLIYGGKYQYKDGNSSSRTEILELKVSGENKWIGKEVFTHKGRDSYRILPPTDHANVLNEDDLADVLAEILDVAPRWIKIGHELGLSNSRMDEISANEHGDPKQCLRVTIQAWLKQNYDAAQYCPPTWEMLCKAIESPAGGDNTALAKKIAKKR